MACLVALAEAIDVGVGTIARMRIGVAIGLWGHRLPGAGDNLGRAGVNAGLLVS